MEVNKHKNIWAFGHRCRIGDSMQDSIAMRDRFNPRSSSVGLKNRDSLLEVIAHNKHGHISDVNEIKMIKPILAQT